MVKSKVEFRQDKKDGAIMITCINVSMIQIIKSYVLYKLGVIKQKG